MAMTESDVFFYPGIVGAEFALSLFDLHTGDVDPELFWLLSLLLTLFFWAKLIQIAAAILRKVFKFEQRRVR